MKKKICALVPMRHSSERVVGKNYRSFAGRPLYHRIITALKECNEIDEIYIDTDSRKIIQDAMNEFPGVRILERPSHLTDGDISMNVIIENSIKSIEADIFLQTHSTNPLLRPETISSAINTFQDSSDNDSLFGVTKLQTRLYDGNGNAINHDPKVLMRTQDLSPIFEENSNIYIFTKKGFAKSRNRIGERPLMYEIDKTEAYDIDTESDFVIAELLYIERENRS